MRSTPATPGLRSPGNYTNTWDAGIRDRLEEADQIEIGCSGCGFGHGEGMTAAIEPDERSPARAPVTYFESALDGTLLQVWVSHASLERIDGQDDPPPPPSEPGEGFGAAKPGKKRAKGDFRGIKLSNKTHRSSTDPDALLRGNPMLTRHRPATRAMCSCTTAMP